MPVMESMPKDEFMAQTKLYSEEPAGSPELHFSIRIPTTWQKSEDGGVANFESSENVLGTIAKYFGPPELGFRQRLEFQAVGLPYQMTARQWLVQYILSNGYNVQGFKFHDDRKAEAAFVLIEGDISYVVRGIAQVNGKNMVFAQHFVPLDLWADKKQMGERIMASFQLKNDVREFAENMMTHHFLDLAVMQYPESWELKMPQIRSIDRFRAELFNISEIEDDYKKTKRLDGKIDVEMISIFVADNLEVEIENLKKALSDKGLTIGESIEVNEDFSFHQGIDYAETEVFMASDTQNAMIDYEFWLTTIAAGDYYFFITLLTPARDEDFFKWSRNSQTYKLVNELLAPQDDAIGF